MPGSAADRRRAGQSRVGLVAAEASEADTVVRAGEAAVAATAALLVTVAIAAEPAAVLVMAAVAAKVAEHLAAVEGMEALWEALPRAAATALHPLRRRSTLSSRRSLRRHNRRTSRCWCGTPSSRH